MDSETIEEFLIRARQTLDQLVMEGRGFRPTGGARELATSITKLQEARMWLGEALREAGYVQPYPNPQVNPSDTTDNAKVA